MTGAFSIVHKSGDTQSGNLCSRWHANGTAYPFFQWKAITTNRELHNHIGGYQKEMFSSASLCGSIQGKKRPAL